MIKFECKVRTEDRTANLRKLMSNTLSNPLCDCQMIRLTLFFFVLNRMQFFPSSCYFWQRHYLVRFIERLLFTHAKCWRFDNSINIAIILFYGYSVVPFSTTHNLCRHSRICAKALLYCHFQMEKIVAFAVFKVNTFCALFFR